MKSFVSKLFKKLASQAGVKIISEPRWGVVGQIITSDGKIRYYRNTCFDINTLGATEIAKDKDYASYFMAKLGYPVIPGEAFFSDNWCKKVKSKRNIDMAYRYAVKLGFPVFVKPNSRSQGQSASKVHTKTEFYCALKRIFKIDNIALVQRVVTGHDYRIVVLDGKIISAYERIPLKVVGDGKSTIMELLVRKQRKFSKAGRDTVIKFKDPRIKEKLSRDGFSFNSILPKGEEKFLLDNANLSTGGDSLDVTESMNQSYKDMAIRLTKEMGLRFCGVDIMTSDPVNYPIKSPMAKWWVIEINAAPGIDNYGAAGKKQQKIVENLYLEVLRAMSK
jgi:D-alanine-D-alanine ligase-like ATP-grasp enzyme